MMKWDIGMNGKWKRATTFTPWGVPLLAAAVIAAGAIAGRGALAQDMPAQKDETEESKETTTETGQPATAARRPAKGIDEMIVTARQREESLQDAPVAISAFSGAELDRYDVTRLQDLSQMTPQMFINQIPGGGNGSITIRGIGTASQGAFEQAVSIYIDGLQYSRGDSLTQGYFDLGRAEVLKGPQALFFGKNSSAGVISLTSADPGKEYELIARSGYEFRADEYWGEAIASGPITDQLGARIAIRHSHIEGFVKNTAPAAIDLGSSNPAAGIVNTAPAPQDRRWPGSDEFLGRLTLVYQPTDALDVKIKLSGANYDAVGVTQGLEYFNCKALGVSQFDPGENCKADWKIRQNDTPPNIVATEPDFQKERGSLYHKYHTISIAAPITYDFNWAKLTSITGYNDYSVALYGDNDFTGTSSSYLSQDASFDSVSQEVRLLTSLDSPVNFLVGGYYQHENYKNRPVARSFSVPADPLTGRLANFEGLFDSDGTTWSGFGQALWNVTDSVELASGVRYSRDTRNFSQVNTFVSSFPFIKAFFLTQGKVNAGDFSDENYSPEVTLTWKKPDTWWEHSDVTLYGAYKQGYKAGGGSQVFLLAATTPDDARFDSETVWGGEMGLKSSWFDRVLRLNIGGYRYIYKDLQTQFFDAALRSSIVENAASATTTGMEAELQWLPPVEGLNLHGSFSYNRAIYDDYLLICYGGQTQALGCNLDQSGNPVPAGGIGVRQQLAGHPREIAPEFTGSFGFLYEMPVPFTDRASLALSSDTSWTDKYNFSAMARPDIVQDAYFRTDASLGLYSKDGRMDVALVGRNLSNQYFFTGVGLEGPNTGRGTGSTVGVLADQLAQVNRPREVGFQFTARF